jgi:hypothetical protein
MILTEENLDRLVEIQQKLRLARINKVEFNEDEEKRIDELRASIDKIYEQAVERKKKELLAEAEKLFK